MARKPKRRGRGKPLTPFGKLLHEQRLEMGITEEQLAQRAKVSRSLVARAMSTPRQTFRFPRLQSLANALCVEFEDRAIFYVTYLSMPGFVDTDGKPDRTPSGEEFDRKLAALIHARFPTYLDLVDWIERGAWRVERHHEVSRVRIEGHPYNWLDDPDFIARCPDQESFWHEQHYTYKREEDSDWYFDTGPEFVAAAPACFAEAGLEIPPELLTAMQTPRRPAEESRMLLQARMTATEEDFG